MASTPSRTDEQIKADVVNELQWDARVDAAKVQVLVEDGTVTLTGKVPTASTRVAAATDAWAVLGVVNVENEMVVELPPEPPAPSGDSIRSTAEDMLVWNADLDASDVSVSFHAGTVTLVGTVPTHWGKDLAEELVGNVRGVLAVNNELAVVPTQDVLDEVVAENVVGALERSALVNAGQIDVTVSDGNVTLRGKVPSAAARFAAYRAASRTSSVKDVRNELLVALA
jgi:osmotically-inducible protein OsmY